MIVATVLNKTRWSKCAEKETVDLPGERTRIDTNDCQILDYTALPAEARFPHIFKGGECDEKVT